MTRKALRRSTCIVTTLLLAGLVSVSQADAGAQRRTERFEQLYKQAKAEQSAGHLQRAVELYRQALSIKPRESQARFELADAYRSWEKYYEARKNYRLALSSNPANKQWEGRCRMGIAASWEAAGQYRQALLEYQLALRADPELVEAQQASKRLASSEDEGR